MYLHRLPRLPRECTAKLKGKRVLRQRLIALVDLSEEVFYALTVEHVHGSEEHTFSFHGPNGDATPANLTLEPYNGATLGEGLEYGDFSSTNAIDPELSCFAFLWEPAKGTPKGVWSLGYALRAHDECLSQSKRVNRSQREVPRRRFEVRHDLGYSTRPQRIAVDHSISLCAGTMSTTPPSKR